MQVTNANPHGLTPKQRQVQEAVERLQASQQLSPSLEEIAAEAGLSVGSTSQIVHILVREKYLTRTPRRARSIRVLRRLELASV